MIPLNYSDGIISRRGEAHVCPKDIRMPNPKKPEYLVNEKAHDLHEYLRHSLRLHSDGYWYMYHDGKYAGRQSKATRKELASWSP